MIGRLFITQSGMWNPLSFVVAAVIILVIVYIIRSTGTKKYKKGTEQTVAFFSGGKAPEENVHPENLYWGFFEAMKRYYKWLMKFHTGIVNDYVYSFVLLVVVVAAVLLLGGAV